MKAGAHQYLALLRGINVGGNNVIRMADLVACFDRMGFADVATYIQSGNILFRAGEQDEAGEQETPATDHGAPLWQWPSANTTIPA